jgi:NAD(P)-dependent dehydrogenase (short-subunit alcohol dehydrogenase family)
MAEQRKILITGASSGFGLEGSKALAARGHLVFASMRGVTGKNAGAAADLRRFAEERKASLEVVELDVTSDASVAQGVERVLSRAGGRLDTLVNNAGVGTWGLQEAFTPEQVRALFDVNVVGILRVNRAVLPSMRRAGKGHVVYVSSGLGRIQLPFLGPYTASKHAVEAIAEIGSYELAPMGIDTTILQPGAYGTAFLSHSVLPADPGRLDEQPEVKAMYEAFAGGFEARVKAGQLGDPREVVEALVEIVEAPPGKRPLRRIVGEDVAPAVKPINEVCAAVQGQLLTRFGLR